MSRSSQGTLEIEMEIGMKIEMKVCVEIEMKT